MEDANLGEVCNDGSVKCKGFRCCIFLGRERRMLCPFHKTLMKQLDQQTNHLVKFERLWTKLTH